MNILANPMKLFNTFKDILRKSGKKKHNSFLLPKIDVFR